MLRLLLLAGCAVLTLFPLFALAPSSAPPETTTPDDKRLVEMAWIAGSWSGAMWGGTFNAYYSTPEGGKVLSYSRLMKDGKESFIEFEVFEEREGVILLQPVPNGRKAVPMPLASIDAEAREAVFEHPEKDYPTRIVYACPTEDQLVITLTDPHGGSEKSERFELRRVGSKE